MGRRPKRKIVFNGEDSISFLASTANETSADSPAISANETPIETKPAHPEIFENYHRVSFTVDSDGRIDTSRLQDKTRIQLKEIFSRPSELEKLGLTPAVSKEISEMGFGEDEANAILTFLTSIDAPIASRLYQVPKDICVKAFTFDDYHRKKLNPPMIRLMNKWGPSVLKTWKDEIGFALIMFSTLSAQVTAMNFMHEQRKKETPAPANVTSITDARAASATPPQSISPEPERPSMGEAGKGLKGIKTDAFVPKDANEEFLEQAGLSI